VFGAALEEDKLYSYRFSTSAQGLLMPHVARKYRAAPITGVSKYGSLTALTGIVRLAGGDDIEIVGEEREIDSVIRQTAVIRLKSKPEAIEEGSIYEKYVGPCGVRPESNNCGDPAPIEFVNSVAPDCCGNVTLEFRGCADVRFIQNETCSVAIGCNFGLSEACVTPDKLPDETGRLPNEYDDLCVSESIFSSSDPFVAFATASTAYSRSPAPAEIDSRLPFVEDFSNQKINDFQIKTGKFDIIADNELPMFGGFSLQSQPKAQSVVLWRKGIPQTNWTTDFKHISAHLSLRRGPVGILHAGGVVFNYHDDTKSYWCVELDHEGTFTGYKGIRLAHYRDSVATTYIATPVPNLALNTQYNIEISIYPDFSNSVWIDARVSNTAPVGSPKHVDHTLGPFLVNNYGDPRGLIGFCAHRSIVQFNRIIVDNIEASSQ
jgi:hypothetical protein